VIQNVKARPFGRAFVFWQASSVQLTGVISESNTKSEPS